MGKVRIVIDVDCGGDDIPDHVGRIADYKQLVRTAVSEGLLSTWVVKSWDVHVFDATELLRVDETLDARPASEEAGIVPTKGGSIPREFIVGVSDWGEHQFNDDEMGSLISQTLVKRFINFGRTMGIKITVAGVTAYNTPSNPRPAKKSVPFQPDRIPRPVEKGERKFTVFIKGGRTYRVVDLIDRISRYLTEGFSVPDNEGSGDGSVSAIAVFGNPLFVGEMKKAEETETVWKCKQCGAVWAYEKTVGSRCVNCGRSTHVRDDLVERPILDAPPAEESSGTVTGEGEVYTITREMTPFEVGLRKLKEKLDTYKDDSPEDDGGSDTMVLARHIDMLYDALESIHDILKGGK